jgi:hypothetical protein
MFRSTGDSLATEGMLFPVRPVQVSVRSWESSVNSLQSTACSERLPPSRKASVVEEWLKANGFSNLSPRCKPKDTPTNPANNMRKLRDLIRLQTLQDFLANEQQSN